MACPRPSSRDRASRGGAARDRWACSDAACRNTRRGARPDLSTTVSGTDDGIQEAAAPVRRFRVVLVVIVGIVLELLFIETALRFKLTSPWFENERYHFISDPVLHHKGL